MNDKPAKPTIEVVTLKQLCAELKIDPRDVKERLLTRALTGLRRKDVDWR